MSRALLCLIILAFASCSKRISEYAQYTVAFGSCNHQWETSQPIWKEIVTHEPDLWIWLGDIIYADTEDMSKMKSDYETQKNHKDYKRLATTTDVIGIWDDHDYGANNSGVGYSQKDASKDLLFSFLEVPDHSLARQRDGAYQSYEHQLGAHIIKIILLDVRYFREEPGPETSILGEEQWLWLEDQLSTSKANMHIIGGGSQFLPEDHRFEKWANYPADRMRLIRLLDEYDVDLPVLISGDRHLAEMSLIADNEGSPILEITSSGLTHSYRGFTEEYNRHRVGGEVISSKNFGKIVISDHGSKLTYRAELYNDSNQLQYSIKSTDLTDMLAAKE